MAQRSVQDGSKTSLRRARKTSFGIFFFVFDFAPFWVQLGLHLTPPPWAPKTAPKSIQKTSENHVAARWPPRSLQDGPRSLQDGPGPPKGCPKTPQTPPRTPPNAPQEAPRSIQERSSSPQELRNNREMSKDKSKTNTLTSSQKTTHKAKQRGAARDIKLKAEQIRPKKQCRALHIEAPKTWTCQ